MINKTQVLEFNDHAYSSVYSAYSILKNLSDPAREVRDKLNNPEHTGISKGDYRRFCQQLDRCNEDLSKLCTMIDEIIDDSALSND